MNHGFMNAMALLWMGSMLVFVCTITARDMDGDAQRSCPRRGCRRMPAGHGCNHAQACEGSLAGPHTAKEV